jgi:hypothetical protein
MNIKFVLRFYIITLFLCCNQYYYKNVSKLTDYKEKTNRLLINEIKIINQYYIIFATRNDSIFKIVSKKNLLIKCDNVIKVGETYNFDLVKIFPNDSIFGIKIVPTFDVSGMRFEDNTEIRTEKSSHYSLYEAKKLNGICLR